MTLKSKNSEDIQQLLSQYKKEISTLIKECSQIATFSKGGITYDALLLKTRMEREVFAEVVSEQLEMQQKMAQAGMRF